MFRLFSYLSFLIYQPILFHTLANRESTATFLRIE